MPAVLLGVALLAGFLLLSWWFTRADSRQIARALRIAAIVAAAVLAIYLLFVARQALLAVLPPLVLFYLRYRAQRRQAGAGATMQAGQSSSIETAYLAMTLDHDSGDTDGEVRQGGFAGRRLSGLSLAELLALRAELAGDPQSLALLEAFLDRVFPDWREPHPAGGPTGTEGPMTEAEAYAILGLEPGATPAEIRAAYRRLMQKLHPDQGGSNWMAVKLNEAKTLLLGE